MALPKYKTSRANTHSRRAELEGDRRADRDLRELRRPDPASHGLPELRFLPRPHLPQRHPAGPHQVSR